MELEYLLGIFPLEIWEMIIDNVDNFRDRYHIISSLPQLGAKLQNKKPKWLFGKVLPILASQLEIAGVLGCRPVCKMWDMDIHNQLVNHKCHQPYNEETNTNVAVNTTSVDENCPFFKMSTSNPVLRFRDFKQIDQFMEMCDRNTYPRGAIFAQTILLDPKIQTNPRQDFEQCWFTLLNRFGGNVKHLSFRSHNVFESAAQFYKRIYSSLQLTPNLKSLSVDFRDHRETFTAALLIAKRPLPLLPFLECVRYTNFCMPCPGNFCHALLSYVDKTGSTVRKLVLTFDPMENNRFALNRCGSQDIYFQFAGLKEVSVIVCHEVLQYFRLEGTGLQKLSLQTNFLTHLSWITSLMSNGHNIRILNISNCGLVCNQVHCLLDLPQLHTIVLRESLEMCYQFLLGLPSLTKLEIIHGSMLELEEDTLINEQELQCRNQNNHFTTQVRKWIYEGPVKSSDIWTLLPTLQELKIKKVFSHAKHNVYKYSRKAYCSNV